MCANTKRSRHEPSLPELPEDTWKEIVYQAADIDKFFGDSFPCVTELIRAENADAHERESEMLSAMGPLRLVDKFFAKTLLAQQIGAAFCVSLRRLCLSSKEKYQDKLNGVTDDLGDDFDRNDVRSMANLTLKAGVIMGVGRGVLHMNTLLHRAGARAYRARKHDQLKSIVELARLANKDDDRAYVNIDAVSWT